MDTERNLRTSNADQNGSPNSATPSGKLLTLRANFSWTLISNVVYAACQWGMIAALAKLGNPDMLGRFALGLAVTTPIMIFARMGLRLVQASDARREFQLRDYIGLRMAAIIAAAVVIAIICLRSSYPRETIFVILIIGFAKAIELVSDTIYGFWQSHERMDLVAVSTMLKGPFGLAGLCAGVYFTGSVVWGAVGVAYAWALVMVCYDFSFISSFLHEGDDDIRNKSSAQSLVPRWHVPTLLHIITIALPLAVIGALDSLWTNTPRYILAHYRGEREVGIFAAVASLAGMGSIVVNALGQSALPRLSRYALLQEWLQFDRLLYRLMISGAGLGILGYFGIYFFGARVLTVLYSPEYAQHTGLLCWLMLAMVMQYTYVYLGTAITAMREFKVLVPVYVLSALANLIGCWQLVPVWGLRGAVWGMFVANVVEVILYTALVIYLRRRRAALVHA